MLWGHIRVIWTMGSSRDLPQVIGATQLQLELWAIVSLKSWTGSTDEDSSGIHGVLLAETFSFQTTLSSQSIRDSYIM